MRCHTFSDVSELRAAVHFRSADDSVTADDLPAGLPIYPAYIDGRYANVQAIRKAHAKALVPTITVNGADPADIVDQENGDATPATAAHWTLGRIHAGKHPTEYFSVSALRANLVALHALGVGPGDVSFWTAHYTSVEHICNAKDCWAQYGWGALPFVPHIVGTQYDDKGAHGEHYDRSVFLPHWPGVDPAAPKPPKPAPRSFTTEETQGLEATTSFLAGIGAHTDPLDAAAAKLTTELIAAAKAAKAVK